jgi:hypothetical protein
MATFLVIGLPCVLGIGFLAVFYIALSLEGARKRRLSLALSSSPARALQNKRVAVR